MKNGKKKPKDRSLPVVQVTYIKDLPPQSEMGLEMSDPDFDRLFLVAKRDLGERRIRELAVSELIRSALIETFSKQTENKE